MSAQHTPGPWMFYADLPSADPNWHIVTNASHMRVIANIHIEPGNEVDLANARLIASAPELLNTLRGIANADPAKWDEEMRDQFREWAQSRARAAIAATGQKGK